MGATSSFSSLTFETLRGDMRRAGFQKLRTSRNLQFPNINQKGCEAQLGVPIAHRHRPLQHLHVLRFWMGTLQAKVAHQRFLLSILQDFSWSQCLLFIVVQRIGLCIHIYIYIYLDHDPFPVFNITTPMAQWALNLRLRTVDADVDIIDQTLLLLGQLGKGKDGLLFTQCPFSKD